MDISMLLIIFLAVPLVAALLMLALPSKVVPAVAYEGVSLASSAAVCALGLSLALAVVSGGQAATAFGPWLRMDALACVFVFLVCVVGLAASAFSVPYIRHDVESGALEAGRVKAYYAFFQIFTWTMLLAILSNSVVLTWVAIELTTVTGAVLVGIYRNRKPSLEAAWKYLIICAAGVAFSMLGIAVACSAAAEVAPVASDAYFWTGLVACAGMLDPLTMQVAFVFALVGFGTKAGLFPMHTWLPDAHSEAPAPVSAMLSGVLLKCAVLAIMRFYSVAVQAAGQEFVSFVLLLFGVATVCFAAVAVYVQNDLKRKLAYSSCENIGLVVVCLGIGGPVGIAAALLHCVFHGLTKSLMFCLSGNVMMRYGTRDLRKMAGIAQVMPVTGVLLGVGLLTLSGMPPFAMFLSEVVAFVAGVQAGYAWLVVVVGLALTAVIAAFVRVLVGSVMGSAAEGAKRADAGAWALVPEVALAAVILWFGVAMPAPVLDGFQEATAIVSHQDADALHETAFVKDLFANASTDAQA